MRHTHTSYNPDALGRSSGRSGADVKNSGIPRNQ